MIDSHHHLWRYEAASFSWVTDDMAVLRQDFLEPQLVKTVESTGVTGLVAVQAQRTVEETEWLLQLAVNQPLLMGVVGWVPLVTEYVGELLDRLRENPKFSGVREILQGAPDEVYFENPAFHRGVRELTRRSLPYDLLIFHHQLPAASRFVAAHPEQRFILDHIAKPPVGGDFPLEWAAHIRELAAFPNIHCKFSGVVTECVRPTWTLDEVRPFWETVLEAFGSSRLMFGSDWPVCLLRSDYHRWLDTVRELAAGLTTGEREAIFTETARRAYSLS
jgi:L-fuconolactonase